MRNDEPLENVGLVPIEVAARELGIEPKRLRGFIARNSLADPIGDERSVYGWSCRALAERLRTVTSTPRNISESPCTTS